MLVKYLVLFVQGCDVLQLGVDGVDAVASVLNNGKLSLFFLKLLQNVGKFRLQTFDIQCDLVTALFVVLALVGKHIECADFWQKCHCLVAKLQLVAHEVDFLLASYKLVVLLLSNFQLASDILVECANNLFCLEFAKFRSCKGNLLGKRCKFVVDFVDIFGGYCWAICAVSTHLGKGSFLQSFCLQSGLLGTLLNVQKHLDLVKAKQVSVEVVYCNVVDIVGVKHVD